MQRWPPKAKARAGGGGSKKRTGRREGQKRKKDRTNVVGASDMEIVPTCHFLMGASVLHQLRRNSDVRGSDGSGSREGNYYYVMINK